ncbi:tyrosinase-like [Eleutherodactylus coqui]|uniref:tyrosinase-like n=1 Tax=Eleutherodactylus coqui TaxID=57060 RepID=UPI003461AEAB
MSFVKPLMAEFVALETPIHFTSIDATPLSTGLGFMNVVFHDFLGVFMVIYLDDILVYFPDWDTHVQHLRLVLTRLREYQLFVKSEKWEKNVKADALSRSFGVPESETMSPENILAPGMVVAAVESNFVPQLQNAQQDAPSGVPEGRWFVPETLHLRVMDESHSSVLAGHPGFQGTLDLCSRHFWWPGMAQEIRNFVRGCSVCACNKSRRRPPEGPLRPLPVPSSPWSQLSVDFITDLPESQLCTTILVVVDRFSKMAHFVALKKLPSAKEFAKIFISSIPGAFITDLHIVSIRAVLASLVIWFLAFGFSAVDGQFPRYCSTHLAVSSKICCPPWNGSPCGEHVGRGECSIMDRSSYDQGSQIPHEDSHCLDDRLYWPTRHYQYYCRCKGNYTGFNCGECKYGHGGEKCDQKKLVVRREIRSLNDTERQRFLRYLTLSKTTTSKDYVILVSSDRHDPVSYQFRNVSIYDLFVWMHHYATKPIYVNCSYTSFSNFAHKGPAFPTWHRRLLLFLEREMQKMSGNEDFALPYYDWRQEENCSVCCDELLGRSDWEGNILENSCFSSWEAICSDSELSSTYCKSADTSGYPDNLHRTPGRTSDSSLPSYQDVEDVLKWDVYDNSPYNSKAKCCFRNTLEGYVNPKDGKTSGRYVHNKVHAYMGGTMSQVTIAANDPMFLVHHNFVDFILELWMQRYKGCPDNYPNNSRLGHGPWDYVVPFYPDLRNRDLLQRSSLFGYTFDNLRACE